MSHSTKALLRSACTTALIVIATGCDISMDLDFSDLDTCAMGCGGWGYPSVPFEPLPTPVAGGMTFTAIVAGSNHSCGISGTDTWCWGERESGTAAYQQAAAPMIVVGGAGITGLSAGSSITCGIAPDNRAMCWGLNAAGEAGTGELGPTWTPTPVKTTLAFASVSVSAAMHFAPAHACGLTAAGAAYCWGDNYFGQLGNGTTQASLVPVPVAGSHVFESISVGTQFSCGIARGGQAHCWGFAGEGQLGNDPANAVNCGAPGTGAVIQCATIPRPVTGGVTFTTLSAGHAFACGLDTDGRAYCWGANLFGQLGDGTFLSKFAPTRVADSPKFTAIEAGGSSTCGLTSERDVMCWGNNGLGQLGDGTAQPRSRPEKVSTTAAFAAITVGNDHACALTVGGAAYCWGSNDAKKLGKGS